MNHNAMDFNKVAEEVTNFIENDLTHKLAEIYEHTGVFPADTFELLKERIYGDSGFDVVVKANCLIRKEWRDERTSN